MQVDLLALEDSGRVPGDMAAAVRAPCRPAIAPPVPARAMSVLSMRGGPIKSTPCVPHEAGGGPASERIMRRLNDLAQWLLEVEGPTARAQAVDQEVVDQRPDLLVSGPRDELNDDLFEAFGCQHSRMSSPVRREGCWAAL